MDEARIAEVVLRLDMPDFKTEAEEAAWWPTQESKLFAAFKEAAENGTLKRARLKLAAEILVTR